MDGARAEQGDVRVEWPERWPELAALADSLARQEALINHLRDNLGAILYALNVNGIPRRFRWNAGRLEAEGVFQSDPEWVVLIDGLAQYHERRMDQSRPTISAHTTPPYSEPVGPESP